MKLLRLVLFLLLPLGLWSQAPIAQRIQTALDDDTRFQPVQIFSWDGPVEPGMQDALSEGHLLTIDPVALQQLYQADLPAVELQLPTGNGQQLTVLLLRQKLLTDDFRVTTSDANGEGDQVQPGRYYAGVIQGHAQSVAAISFFENEVMGVLETATHGTMELGKVENDLKQRYVLYQTKNLDFQPVFDCGVEDIEHPKPQQLEPLAEYNSLNCVRIYFECEYDMYLENGSVQNTVNKMTGIYNVVKVLYDNENIQTTISEIFVWNTPDSYATSSTSNALTSFRTGRPNFNGDLAHLVSRGAPTGGGVAWLDQVCGSYNYAYSFINAGYSQFPTYSWTVMVIAHEMGHNLGSHHTHDCVWDVNGDGTANEAIDGCGPAAGYSSGNCSAPLPANGGTVMSYCHLIGNVGINLNNGFGPLPGNKMRSRVYNASCLSPCSNCTHTVSITKTDIQCNGDATGSATATPSGGAGPFTYAWPNGQNTQTVSGLTAGSYTVTVTDTGNGNCPATATVTISQPAALNLSANISQESFPGATDGAINLTVTGGTPGYAYTWSNNATTQDISGLPGGSYTVTVTDNNNCTASQTYAVATTSCDNQITTFPYSESFEGSFGAWEQPTNDGFDWTLNVGNTPTTKTGPAGAFDLAWYAYTEANGNAGTAYLVSPCLDFSDKADQEIVFSYHMDGNQMGSLALEASNNNGNTWTELWSISGDQGANWQTLTVSLAGYTSMFTKIRFAGTLGTGPRSDIAIDAVTINASAAPCNGPQLTTTSTNVSCFGGNDGTASVTATGGVQPYTFQWSTEQTTSSVSGLPAGNYVVTVTGADGCPAEATIAIDQPDALDLTLAPTNESSAGANDGAIDLTVAGGTPVFTYQWSNAATSEDLSNIGAGAYTVIVTDANGCTASGSATVNVAPPCEPVVATPYLENFDVFPGNWTQSTNDGTDWTRYSGSTPSKFTGPSTGTNYLYTEATNHFGQTAIIESPCFNLGNMTNPVIQFDWHMYGSQMGALYLEVTVNGTTWTTLWSRSGNNGDGWVTETVAGLSAPEYTGQIVRLRFRGEIGSGHRSDMAIDNVALNEGSTLPAGLVTSLSKAVLWPNPANEEVVVQLQSPADKNVRLRIADFSGREYQMREYQLFSGANELSIPVSQMPNGLYWMIVEDGKERQLVKFVVQH